jgi:arylsulfatase
VDPKNHDSLTPPAIFRANPAGRGRLTCAAVKARWTLETFGRALTRQSRPRSLDYLDRNDPKRDQQGRSSFGTTGRMHITTVFSPTYEAILGWRQLARTGDQRSRMKQLDDNIGVVSRSGGHRASTTNTNRVLRRHRCEVITFGRRHNSLHGRKVHYWEGGMRAPLVVRWQLGINQARSRSNVASLDWCRRLRKCSGAKWERPN